MSRFKYLFVAGCILLSVFQPTAAAQKFCVEVPEKQTAQFPMFNRQASYLIDRTGGQLEVGLNESGKTLSGWDLDTRGGIIDSQFEGYTEITDNSSEFLTSMERYFERLTTGKFTFETDLNFVDLEDGFSIRFFDSESGADALHLLTKNNSIGYADKNGEFVSLFSVGMDEVYRIKAVFDIDKQTIEFCCNGEFVSTFDFCQDVKSVDKIKLSTTDEGWICVRFTYIRLYVNYLANERFLSVDPKMGAIPYGWEEKLNSNSTARVEESGYVGDEYSLFLNLIGENRIQKKFEPYQGGFIAEFKYLMPKHQDGVRFTLGGLVSPICSVETKGNKLILGNGTEIDGGSENVWQTIRFEGCTYQRKLKISHNGKVVAKDYPMESEVIYIDHFAVSSKNGTNAQLWFDDLYVNPTTKVDDYVAEPVASSNDDYLVGMMGCNLWRNGYHSGWDTISAHPEQVPLLGFYDDGNPELSDWELKFMAEHGIDFYNPCWYMPERYMEGPIKISDSYSDYAAIHNGYFNAKYSDRVNLAIMYVVANKVTSDITPEKMSKIWRETIIPFWVDYYLSDKRYQTVGDNLALITFYAAELLAEQFGSDQKAKEEFDYLRNVCKQLGYNGAFLTNMIEADDATRITRNKNFGMDAFHVYSHGTQSYLSSYQIERGNIALSQKAYGNFNAVLSMGYSDHAWHSKYKYPFITAEEYRKAAEYVRDEYLPSYDSSLPSSKLVFIDNWNELGEGHFMTPTPTHGFELLDVIRDVFTDMPKEHTDVIPTAAQKERLGRQYPDGRSFLRHEPDVDGILPSNVRYSWNFSNRIDCYRWNLSQCISGLGYSNGVLKGTVTATDPQIVLSRNVNININDVTYVKVRMKSNLEEIGAPHDTLGIFFRTAAGGDHWYDTVRGVDVMPGDGMKDYYIKVKGVDGWSGTLTRLRVDPSSRIMESGDKGVTFEIEKIELLSSDNVPVGVYFDGEFMDNFGIDPVKNENGVILAPVDPIKGFHNKVDALMVWDNATKTVTFSKDDVTMVFTMNKNTAVINGIGKEIGCTPYIFEGLPMLPVKLIAETFGASAVYKEAQARLDVTVPKSAKDLADEAAIAARVPYSWEFDVDTDSEGWTLNPSIFARTKVSNGRLYLRSKVSDMLMIYNDINMPAKNNKLRIRLKNNTSNGSLVVFFTTAEGQAFGENTAVFNISTNDTEFKEYEFDLGKNSQWQGNIKSLRIDPVTAVGTVEIDYIRFQSN